MDSLTEKRLGLSDDLLDRMIEWEGVGYAIDYLIELGFSREELILMAFNVEDIDAVILERGVPNE